MMDFMNGNSIFKLTLLTLCVSFTGCGGAPADQPDLGQVKGTITFEGSPLAGASVTFIPDGGRPAKATTDPAGNYELIYIRDTPGCKLGHNRVTITSVNEEEDESESDEGNEDAEPVNTKPKGQKEILPAKYNTDTELEANVEPGENIINFDLKKS